MEAGGSGGHDHVRGVALAEEYSAFVVGEFEAAGAIHTGEGRFLPLHGQCRGLSEFSGEVMDELPGLRFAQ